MHTEGLHFKNILGNKSTIANFVQVLNKRDFGDVWLIQGPKGIGKSKLITYLSAKMLELANFDDKKIINPDFFLIKQESPEKKFISVDNVRRISQFFSTTSNNKRKIAMIDSVSELNNHGHNSLLKTLENLPKYSHVFLIDHMSQPLPATIKSRCKTIVLKPLEISDIYTIIENKFGPEDNDLLEFYSRLSNGSAGEAIKLYEYNSKILYDSLSEFIISIRDNDVNLFDKYINKLKENENKFIFKNIFFKLFNIILIKSLKKKSGMEPLFLNNIEEKAVVIIANELSFENHFEVLEYIQNLNSDINSYNLDIKNSIYATLIKFKHYFK